MIRLHNFEQYTRYLGRGHSSFYCHVDTMDNIPKYKIVENVVSVQNTSLNYALSILVFSSFVH